MHSPYTTPLRGARIPRYYGAMLIAWISVIVMIIGVLAYALSSNAKVQELGRIAYFVGLFWVVAKLAEHAWRIPT